MKTVCFIGDPNPHYSSYNWMINAQELGYSSRLNDLSGLTRNDVIIVDKFTEVDISSSPAKKILYFPDVIGPNWVTNRYIRHRTSLLLKMAHKVDIIVVPPNVKVMNYAHKVTKKPVFKMLFGVYTSYFQFVPPTFPHKSVQRGFCWSLGSRRRDQLIAKYGLAQIQGFGQEMIHNLSKCHYAFNAHYTSLPNNEQRLTEIPLALTIPVSEPLSDPEQLAKLHIVPLNKVEETFLDPEQYRALACENLNVVMKEYNSRESLKLLLSYLRSP
ncbi:MAG: hypothetical protein AB1512_09810 [Thermodesulfobacteriota bacterium]